MRFVDEARILVKAGKGGPGLVSFRREKFVPKGGPDGGDGGMGGEVIIVAQRNLHTLLDLTHRHHFAAKNGRPGGPNQATGKSGSDCVIEVPVGVQVFGPDGDLLADLTEPGQQFVAAGGGRGGKGNRHFVSSTMRAPRFAQPGEPGEEAELKLELKLLAEVGLVGKPNAGKSTLLAALSAARPKIAGYPFTTLTPNLGVVRAGEDRSFVMADVPGLIEGAHTGTGLGIRFLKHIERTRLLLHLVEVTDLDADEPMAEVSAIRGELEAHSAELVNRPRVLVVTKMDLTGADEILRRAEPALTAAGEEVMAVSAVARKGLDDLVAMTYHRLERLRGKEDDERLH